MDITRAYPFKFYHQPKLLPDLGPRQVATLDDMCPSLRFVHLDPHGLTDISDIQPA